jgi:CheY-like chemotaxis protein
MRKERRRKRKLVTKNLKQLIRDLKGGNWRARLDAAKSLGELGDTRVVEPPIYALDGEDIDLREAAATALGDLGDLRAVEPLIATLRDGNCDVGLRRAAAEALGKLGDLHAVKPLTIALGDSNEEMREVAAEALDKLRWIPQTDEEKVGYWIAKGEWDRCAAIGELAVEPLIDLVDPDGLRVVNSYAQSSIRQVLARRFRTHDSVARALEKSPKLILVVEDERDIRELIVISLQAHGFRCIEARNGEDAIAMARISNPDLILLDIRMPKLTGYEACEVLKHDPNTSHVPIVFLSAKGQEAEIRRGIELGAVEYITKPVSPDELIHYLRDVFHRHRLGIYEED